MFNMSENLIRTAVERGITERELMILLDRARGLTLREIAEDEGVSRERIRQIEARAVKRFKNSMKSLDNN